MSTLSITVEASPMVLNLITDAINISQYITVTPNNSQGPGINVKVIGYESQETA